MYLLEAKTRRIFQYPDVLADPGFDFFGRSLSWGGPAERERKFKRRLRRIHQFALRPPCRNGAKANHSPVTSIQCKLDSWVSTNSRTPNSTSRTLARILSLRNRAARLALAVWFLSRLDTLDSESKDTNSLFKPSKPDFHSNRAFFRPSPQASAGVSSSALPLPPYRPYLLFLLNTSSKISPLAFLDCLSSRLPQTASSGRHPTQGSYPNRLDSLHALEGGASFPR